MRVVILGGGESGVGAAYLAKAKGFDVFLSDMGTIRENYKKNWTSLGLNMKTDTHRRKILNADWIIKSPGIPKKAEMVQKIQEKGIRLSSEIEFASEFTNAKIIAITGSNGKTTTTSLIYYILKKTD
jgi:UDP-N-acetylmuramoylalanine--D-glutamate ligase